MGEQKEEYTGLSALELDKVLDLLAKEAGCEGTRAAIYRIEPVYSVEEATESLERTDETYRLIAQHGSPSVYGLRPVKEALDRAKLGGVLSMDELLGVAESLRTTRSFATYGQHLEPDTLLGYSFFSLFPDETLEKQIFEAIKSPEEMEDTASSELANIRRKIRLMESRIRESLDGMIRSTQFQKYLQDAIVTMRDGRFVLPVKSEYRAEVKGLVHDTSSSGATLFIEPMRVVEMNNDIAVLKSSEQEEIRRILAAFSIRVGENADRFAQNYNEVINLDLLFSKARLAYTMKATMPILNDTGIIDLKEARHPLIDENKVAPTHIIIGENYSTLVITGPNTGGKTVTLKTLGLLTLMAQCGLLIPAKEGSQVAVYEKILVDIGDEQSIEQSLSTFSAHMTHIVSILRQANNRSLVLIDELGAGTDPTEGAALAISILEKLKEEGATIAATTHYSELKVYALETDGVENASCEFDIHTLSPTYKLLIGVPGRSNAFAISKRLGLSDEIINRAESLVSAENQRLEKVVSALDDQRKALEEEQQKAHDAYLEAEKIRMAAKNANRTFEEQREKELERARFEARHIVESVQSDANHILNEISQIRKQIKDPTIQNQLSNLKSQVNQSMKGLYAGTEDTLKAEVPVDDKKVLEVGDQVELINVKKQGTVVEVSKNNEVTVQIGGLRTKAKRKDLRFVGKTKAPAKQISSKQRQSKSSSKIARSGSREVDVRGKNVEEALIEIDQFLDDAVFSHVSTLTIIHGKGTGVLRNAIQQHLRTCKNVNSFRLGAFGEGEDGVTIVEMK